MYLEGTLSPQTSPSERPSQKPREGLLFSTRNLPINGAFELHSMAIGGNEATPASLFAEAATRFVLSLGANSYGEVCYGQCHNQSATTSQPHSDQG